jgi:hypothetical protein
MSAPEILKDSRRLGIELTADGGNLMCKAPKGALTVQLSEAIGSHKFDLLSLLTDDNNAARVDTHTEPSGHEVDRRRRASGVPRKTRQDDRRTAPSNPSTQGSTTKKPEGIEPAGPCLDCGLG